MLAATMAAFPRVHVLATVISLAFGCAEGEERRADLPPLPTGKADDYAQTGVSCGGWPRVAVDTADFACAGLVAGDDGTTFSPRTLLELPGRPYEFLVTDLAAWSPDSGGLFYLDARTPPTATLTRVLSGLSLPHLVTLGPEEHVFVGEDTRIFAFPASAVGTDGAIDESQIVTVIDGLPPMDRGGARNSYHPLSHFVFDDAGHLYLNVGAFSDHCAGFVGGACLETDGTLGGGPAATRPDDEGAVIRRYAFRGSVADGWYPTYRVVAFGLRNSMGLAFAPNGDLLQAENSRDFRESNRPYEELNVIPRAELDGEAPPKHYGWPYCYDIDSTSDEWGGFAAFPCSLDNPNYRPPHVLLPPHGAPLGLAYYHGAMFEELEGQLLVPLHGYRPAGHRVLALPVDPSGLPLRHEGATYLEDPTGAGGSVERPYPTAAGSVFASMGTYLVDAWFEVADVRPKGAPVAPYVAADGTIWIADDKNRSILVFGRSTGALPATSRVDLYPAYRRLLDEDESLRGLYDAMVTAVLRSGSCRGCHDDFRLIGDDSTYPELRYLLALGGWIRPGDPEESALYARLTPVGSAGMPPIDRAWPTVADGEAAVATVRAFIEALPEVTPAFNEGFIGGPCTVDADCDYDGGVCEPAGFCSLPCTLARPFCPDRTGNASTFCIDLGAGRGGCVAQCDASEPMCLADQTCIEATRLGREDARTVCR
jgi:hypothetical protein